MLQRSVLTPEKVDFSKQVPEFGVEGVEFGLEALDRLDVVEALNHLLEVGTEVWRGGRDGGWFLFKGCWVHCGGVVPRAVVWRSGSEVFGTEPG